MSVRGNFANSSLYSTFFDYMVNYNEWSIRKQKDISVFQIYSLDTTLRKLKQIAYCIVLEIKIWGFHFKYIVCLFCNTVVTSNNKHIWKLIRISFCFLYYLFFLSRELYLRNKVLILWLLMQPYHLPYEMIIFPSFWSRATKASFFGKP